MVIVFVAPSLPVSSSYWGAVSGGLPLSYLPCFPLLLYKDFELLYFLLNLSQLCHEHFQYQMCSRLAFADIGFQGFSRVAWSMVHHTSTRCSMWEIEISFCMGLMCRHECLFWYCTRTSLIFLCRVVLRFVLHHLVLFFSPLSLYLKNVVSTLRDIAFLFTNDFSAWCFQRWPSCFLTIGVELVPTIWPLWQFFLSIFSNSPGLSSFSIDWGFQSVSISVCFWGDPLQGQLVHSPCSNQESSSLHFLPGSPHLSVWDCIFACIWEFCTTRSLGFLSVISFYLISQWLPVFIVGHPLVSRHWPSLSCLLSS